MASWGWGQRQRCISRCNALCGQCACFYSVRFGDGIASGRMGYLMCADFLCADFLQAQEAKDTAGQKMQQAKK